MKDISQYFARVWQTREGWHANCPRCADGERKFYWNVDKEVGCCFHHDCQWYYSKGGVTIARASAFFSSAGLALQIPDVVESEGEAEVQLPEEFKVVGSLEPELKETLYAYLESRDLGKKIVKAARVGYCKSGRWWGYLVFPVFNDEGKVVYWQGRRFKEREPKFYNPKSSQKSELVYRINPNVRPRKIVLVESIINTLTIDSVQSDPTVVMAILGSSLSEIQKQYILRFEKRLKEVCIAMDGDKRREGVEMAEQFWAAGIRSTIAPIPDGEDINSLGRKEALRRISRAEVFHKGSRSEIITRKIA